MRVVIIGNGMVGNLCALYLRRRLPETAEIVLVGPATRGGMPVVGESTIEVTAQFLENKLGLGPYLREHHYPKYALTYYFKLDPSNPKDRRYSIHCNEREPTDLPPLDGGWEGPMARPPSWQLNRELFDRDMQQRIDDTDGIERVEGMVRSVQIDGSGGHTLEVSTPGGGNRRLTATWVIDASGRRRVLGRTLGLRVEPSAQRNSFWFRLSGADRTKLQELEAFGPQPPGVGESYHYDRFYTTHHFMGRGNWIWMIPLRSQQREDLFSIGITMRPDHFEGEVCSMDAFMERVRQVHPVITDLVATGTVEDTNVLRKFHYTSSQAYSQDRWAIVGDAAFAPDPLFSNGLTFSSIQMEQIGEMIARDCAGDHDPEYISLLDRNFWAPLISSQESITRWYETMHDAFISSLRLNWIEMVYFYVLLPLVTNRAHYDPKTLPAWSVLTLRTGGDTNDRPFDLPQQLMEVRKLFDTPRPEHFIYRGKAKVNLRAMEQVANVNQLFEQIRAGQRLRLEYIADAAAQVRLAEGLPTDRTPVLSM